MRRRTFLSHWILCLLCAGAFAFAWDYGVPQKVWASEARWMAAVIFAWFIFSAARIGMLAWKIDEDHPFLIEEDYSPARKYVVDTRFGSVAYEMSVILGVLGMAVGLSWQGQSIAQNGTAIFGAWAVQLYSTILGVGCGAILFLMAHLLESGRRQ